MARMEFLTENRLNTTTQLKVDSNTVTAEFLFDRNIGMGYTSNGYSGVTATTISIEFVSPVVLSHVLLQNHNMKSFRVFYDSATANSLLVNTTNSATSTYLAFASVTVSSLQVQMNEAITAGQEKRIGELVAAERQVQFERNPSVRKWKPTIFRKQIEHEMPDGGTVLFNIKDKYRANLSWEFVTTSFRDDLYDVYATADPLYFIPFPTATSWDGSAHEAAWVGDFDFKHATNDKTQGFSGSILLKETPGR
jgi:hypothetical protein